MVERLDRIIEQACKEDDGCVVIRLYSSPIFKHEKKHNKDMEKMIHTFGSLTEDMPDEIGFCTCVASNEKYKELSFGIECLRFMNNKIKKIKGE